MGRRSRPRTWLSASSLTSIPAIGRGQLTSIKGGEAYRAGETDDDIPGVVIIDDHTIRFDFEKPTGHIPEPNWWIFRSTFPILPEHILGKIDTPKLGGH